MLPNAVIVGAPKSGTTSLHRWLTDHPDVIGPVTKETGYFVDPDSHAFRSSANYRDHGLPGYEVLFRAPQARSTRAVVEVAPDYMFQRTALAHLPDLPSRPVIVFVLREPAAQVYSLFNYLKNNWQYVSPDMPFTEFIELARMKSPALASHELLQNAIENCRYVDFIDRWSERCGRERIRVLLFEDLVADQRTFMRRISKELKIDPTFYDSYAFPRENATYRVRSPRLQALNVAVRKRLPKGRAYNALRRVYRHVNTKEAAGRAPVRDDDRATLSDLRRELVPANQALANRYGLDLRAWGQ